MRLTTADGKNSCGFVPKQTIPASVGDQVEPSRAMQRDARQNSSMSVVPA
jgi:hypothetical protein